MDQPTKPKLIPKHFPGTHFDLIVMAASAGGLTALSRLLADLPEGFPAALAVVQHLDPHHRSLMADILSRRITLEIKQAEAGDRLHPGTVFIAPPDRHLLVDPEAPSHFRNLTWSILSVLRLTCCLNQRPPATASAPSQWY